MNCDAYRDEFSALLDREEPMLAPGVLDAHLTGCDGCRAWAAAATNLHRAARVTTAPDVPDLVAPILAAAARQRREARPTFDVGALVRVARLALAAIGVAEIVTAASGLFARNEPGTTLHAFHELGSFDLALAVGFLSAAAMPRLARGMLPLVIALVAALAVVTVGDVVSSHAGWAGESVHLLSVLGIPSLWLAGLADRAPERWRGSEWGYAAPGVFAG